MLFIMRNRGKKGAHPGSKSMVHDCKKCFLQEERKARTLVLKGTKEEGRRWTGKSKKRDRYWGGKRKRQGHSSQERREGLCIEDKNKRGRDFLLNDNKGALFLRKEDVAGRKEKGTSIFATVVIKEKKNKKLPYLRAQKGEEEKPVSSSLKDGEGKKRGSAPPHRVK